MTLIDRGDGMQVLRKSGRKESRTMVAVTVPPVHGLAGWVLGLLRGWHSQHETKRKQLRLVETLSLGGKRQLMLVTCGGESFLVGGGPESVETIVRLETEVWPDMTSKSLDEPCR